MGAGFTAKTLGPVGRVLASSINKREMACQGIDIRAKVWPLKTHHHPGKKARSIQS
jgi:hypothetical protein